MRMFRPTRLIGVSMHVALAVSVAFLPGAVQAISIVKTTVTTTAAALAKGEGFSLIGPADQGTSVFLSVRVFEWSQTPDDPLVLTETTDITTFPQLVRVDAGQVQSVRIQSTKPLEDQIERYYRIVIEEFDTLEKPSAAPAVTLSVRNKPRVTVPMIVRTKVPVESGVAFVQSVIPGIGAARPCALRIGNSGRTFVLVMSAVSGAAKVDRPTAVLPGKSATIQCPADLKSKDRVVLNYQVSAGKSTLTKASAEYVVP